MVERPLHSGRVTHHHASAAEPSTAKRSGRFSALGVDLFLVVSIFVSAVLVIPSSAPGWVRFVPAAIAWTYPILSIGLWGRTIGQLLVGIRVVRVDDFGTPGLGRAAVRALGLFVPAAFVPEGVGYVAAAAAKGSFAFTESRQGVHDRLAGTLVVNDFDWKAWSERSE